MIKLFKYLFALCLVGLIAYGISQSDFLPKNSSQDADEVMTVLVQPKSFSIEVRTVGELEAAQSKIISSAIRGDYGKVIELIPDGTDVEPGELLVRMDPTPFEQKIDELSSKLAEQEVHIETLEKTLQWEIKYTQHELKASDFEVETAGLELNKIINGDGPLETHRLRSAMQKAQVKYDELAQYSNDILKLESEGYLNSSEVKATFRKLDDEKQSFEDLKMQYESYINHVLPMQIKKAETNLKKINANREQLVRSGKYKVGVACTNLRQAMQTKEDLEKQIDNAENELALTEIYSTAPGMVVHREEYRQSSQKRKPRVGDVLVRNQAIMEIPDLSSMIVRTKVREVDLNKIEIGKPVTIEVDAYPRTFFKGTVDLIGILAMSEISKMADEKYFEVKITLNNTDNRLRPGMTARVTIHSGVVGNKLSIPIHALFEQDKVPCCYVKTEDGYMQRRIDIGRNNEHWVEVISGINEGDQVALSLPSLMVDKK